MDKFRVKYRATFEATVEIDAETKEEAMTLFGLGHVECDGTESYVDWEAVSAKIIPLKDR